VRHKVDEQPARVVLVDAVVGWKGIPRWNSNDRSQMARVDEACDAKGGMMFIPMWLLAVAGLLGVIGVIAIVLLTYIVIDAMERVPLRR